MNGRKIYFFFLRDLTDIGAKKRKVHSLDYCLSFWLLCMFLFSFDMAVSVGRLMVKSKRESSFVPTLL